jgi:hypothetical protein
MNVGQLRKAIAHLPDDMPVAIQSECRWSDLNLYVCDANISNYPDHPSLSGYLSDGHVDTSKLTYKDHTNTTALLFSDSLPSLVSELDDALGGRQA